MKAMKKKAPTNISNRHAIFLLLIKELLRMSHDERVVVADNAGVATSTLYTWTHGATVSPRIDTLAKVAGALGYEIVLQRVGSRKAKLYRVK